MNLNEMHRYNALGNKFTYSTLIRYARVDILQAKKCGMNFLAGFKYQREPRNVVKKSPKNITNDQFC